MSKTSIATMFGAGDVKTFLGVPCLRLTAGR